MVNLFDKLVFDTAYIEGLDVTLDQVKSVINNKDVSSIDSYDREVIVNLVGAWSYMFNNLDVDFDLGYINKINSYVSYNESLAWGVLRGGNVGVSGTDYSPPIPVETEVKSFIHSILVRDDKLQAILEYYCIAVKSQWYWDGNKRTQMIAANRLLIENGLGVLRVGEHNAYEYNVALNHYYNTDNLEFLVSFLISSIIKI